MVIKRKLFTKRYGRDLCLLKEVTYVEICLHVFKKKKQIVKVGQLL